MILKRSSKIAHWGAWVAQSVKHRTLFQVIISQLVSSRPASGSMLAAQILEPASVSVSPSLFLPHPCSVSFSLSLKNKHLKNLIKSKQINKKKKDGTQLPCSLCQWESFEFLTIKYQVRCEFFVDSLYQFENLPLYSYISENFSRKG